LLKSDLEIVKILDAGIPQEFLIGVPGIRGSILHKIYKRPLLIEEFSK
jgi:hypothetical protein